MRSILITLAVGFFLFSCAPREMSNKDVVPESPSPPVATIEAEGWQLEWESTLTLARKEGRVVIYSSGKPETRNAFENEFKKKTGIVLEFLAGRPPELVQKILSEQRGGLFIPDLYLSGTTTAFQFLKPKGMLKYNWENLLFLPEVIDPRVWWEGKLPWVDKERTFIHFTASPSMSYYRNTNLVSTGEITSFKNFLNPKWKGRIVINDPSAGSGGTNTLFHIARFVLDLDYIKELAKQEPMILRDERLQLEWVARGKYAISIGAPQPLFAEELQKLGLPLAALLLEEGTYITRDGGQVTMLNDAPHPNAAKIFLNWILTREAQTVYSRKDLYQSARLDVLTDHLPEYMKRKEGVPYLRMDTEEIANESYKYREKFAKIFGIK